MSKPSSKAGREAMAATAQRLAARLAEVVPEIWPALGRVEGVHEDVLHGVVTKVAAAALSLDNLGREIRLGRVSISDPAPDPQPNLFPSGD